jgi:hypothetical protein
MNPAASLPSPLQPWISTWEVASLGMQRLTRIQSSAWQAGLKLQIELAQDCCEVSAQEVAMMSQNSNPVSACCEQSRIASEFTAKVFDHTLNFFDRTARANSEITSCLSDMSQQLLHEAAEIQVPKAANNSRTATGTISSDPAEAEGRSTRERKAA